MYLRPTLGTRITTSTLLPQLLQSATWAFSAARAATFVFDFSLAIAVLLHSGHCARRTGPRRPGRSCPHRRSLLIVGPPAPGLAFLATPEASNRLVEQTA